MEGRRELKGVEEECKLKSYTNVVMTMVFQNTELFTV